MWHHLSSVSYRYKCNNCPYGTNKKTNFDTHSYVHRPDRTHWCSFCGNGFTTDSS
uniref:Zinc finger protein 23 n=1 Tax=Parasteatoda tepidariorum TaxID=114398 RepID=A0A2L2YXB8_PARTP